MVCAAISDARLPARVVLAHVAGQVQIVVSPLLLGELAEVLLRPKFRSRLTAEMGRAFVRALAEECELFSDPPAESTALTPDPDDDYLVRLARSCGAEAIVSSDAHLTDLVDPNPPVLIPRQLVERLPAQ